MKTTTL